MREFSVPASYLVEPGDNVTDDVFSECAELAGRRSV